MNPRVLSIGQPVLPVPLVKFTRNNGFAMGCAGCILHTPVNDCWNWMRSNQPLTFFLFCVWDSVLLLWHHSKMLSIALLIPALWKNAFQNLLYAGWYMQDTACCMEVCKIDGLRADSWTSSVHLTVADKVNWGTEFFSRDRASLYHRNGGKEGSEQGASLTELPHLHLSPCCISAWDGQSLGIVCSQAKQKWSQDRWDRRVIRGKTWHCASEHQAAAT